MCRDAASSDDVSDANGEARGGGVRFRKLRIAWSVMFGIVAVLPIALWVRSYWVQDRVFVPIGGPNQIEVDSAAGMVWVVRSDGFSIVKLNKLIYQLTLDGELLAFAQKLRKKTLLGFANFEEIYMFVPIRTTVVPHWSLALLCAGLGYVSWLPWSNRFGLRTLLLTMTLVAVVLAVYTTRK
jgi:hypothetical protein